MAFLVCLLFRESIGVAITKSFVIFVRKFFVSSLGGFLSAWTCVTFLMSDFINCLDGCEPSAGH